MIEKLQTVDAFIVFDLHTAPTAMGVVRSARKILTTGASDLARSQTYTFATFEMRHSGASAGINATDETRSDAIDKFASEIAPMVATGRFMPEPGTRVPRSALKSLTPNDQRANIGTIADQALTAGVIAAANFATNGLEGRSVSIEGFGISGPALAKAVMAQGGKVVAVCANDKGAVAPSGFSADALSTPDAVPFKEQTAAQALATPADVLLAGSKMGAINHTVAEQLNVKALVPYAPIPVTAKALATLTRAGTKVIPDFISTAGALFAWWPSTNTGTTTILTDAANKISISLQEIADHPDGLFLAACYRAEAFLTTWQKTLPFGRPLAA
ncbi:MAG: hypothetical protein F4138_02145 [Acidimicrobiia bacterium]|nr:hypothetical protein [Acidimicrobiia bacterium]